MTSDKELKDRLHTEQVFFSQRLNMFFVAESMLIIAFITILSNEVGYNIDFLFAIVGTVVTFIFFFVFWDNSKELKNLAVKVKNQTNYVGISPSINYFFGIVLPSLFIIIWGSFIFLSLIK